MTEGLFGLLYPRFEFRGRQPQAGGRAGLFDVLKAVAGSLVSSDGFRIILYVPDMRGIDVSECLSLADVNYFARQAGWGQLQAEHPSRIELHGFEMSKDGLRLEALARGNDR